MVEQIKAYKASDGEIFEHIDQAKSHERGIKFGVWLDEQVDKYDFLCPNSDPKEVLNFLINNQDMIESVFANYSSGGFK